MPMNPEIKALWLDALRSGEYQQTQQRLRWYDRFCCLGVLCDLHVKAGRSEWVSSGGFYYHHASRNEAGVLQDDVLDWAGLDPNQANPRMGGEPLIDLNDNGATFSEIADLIEKFA